MEDIEDGSKGTYRFNLPTPIFWFLNFELFYDQWMRTYKGPLK